VVGEVAQAHDGSLGTAHAFIDAIADAGADAVKFQTHLADAESTPTEPWRVRFSPQDATRYEYWKRMEFTEEQWYGLKEHADRRGLIFLSSPFSAEAVALLARIGVPAWKIASGQVTDPVIFPQILSSGLPVILSTGMSSLEEIDKTVAVLEDKGMPYAVLQCTSSYPSPPARIGLNLLPFFRNRYRCPVGLSDHSGTIYPAIAAVALGAAVVEVHVTLSRQAFGPDVSSSVTTAELHQVVEGARFVAEVIANPVDKDEAAMALAPMRELFTKSLVARRDLPAGARVTSLDLAAKKPGTGIPARRLPEFEGRRLRRSVRADEILREEDFEPLIQPQGESDE
jgi:N-acetylneuraminate synthase